MRCLIYLIANVLTCAQVLSDGGSRNPVKIVKGSKSGFNN